MLQLILPFLDLQIEYYDLGLEHRDATNDGAWLCLIIALMLPIR